MVSLSQAQVISGGSKPFLEEVASIYSYVSATWLSGIRTFLNSCNGKITIKNVQEPELQCVNNSYIMDKFSTAKPGNDTLDQLNR
eukprot:1180235-Ditylum_brightwellii.AAC.1